MVPPAGPLVGDQSIHVCLTVTAVSGLQSDSSQTGYEAYHGCALGRSWPFSGSASYPRAAAADSVLQSGPQTDNGNVACALHLSACAHFGDGQVESGRAPRHSRRQTPGHGNRRTRTLVIRYRRSHVGTALGATPTLGKARPPASGNFSYPPTPALTSHQEVVVGFTYQGEFRGADPTRSDRTTPHTPHTTP